MKKAKSCNKGYPCGGGCISITYTCRKDFSEGVSVSIDGFRRVIMKKKSSPMEEALKSQPKEKLENLNKLREEVKTFSRDEDLHDHILMEYPSLYNKYYEPNNARVSNSGLSRGSKHLKEDLSSGLILLLNSNSF